MIKPNNEHMPCPVCLGEVEGRSDKRYCSTDCKNKHHRIAFQHTKTMVREQNGKLRRNLTLLEGILGEEHNAMNIHKDTLIARGFDMGSCTGFVTKGKTTIYSCYLYRYWVTDDGIVHVVKSEFVSDFMPGFYERYTIDYPDVGFNRKFRRSLERKNNGKNRGGQGKKPNCFPKRE